VRTTRGWSAEPYDVHAAARLGSELGLSPAAAAILVRRGHADPAAARDFLAAAQRTDPAALPGAPAACEAILRHVRAGSRIAVFGDYDVDGVCSTAMMVRTLRTLGADPTWRLPSRDEGYGLSAAAVRELAAGGVRLLVTVDCGITGAEEVALAQECGMEVVVTDHHRPPPTLPACPVVHPGLGEGPGEELCAAGVVLKLSEALRARAGLDPAGAEEDLDLAGLATVCDMVPLLGENRRIAREGIEALSRTQRPGLRALMRVAALEAADVDVRCAGFRLGPRLNAAGRLGRADAALELLLTEDPERADQVAGELDGLNLDRRETELRILCEAEAAAADQLHAAAIVVAGEGWHPGVVGIVASRLVERHRRPCVVVGLEGGRGRGSGRSIGAYDLHAGLAAGAEHLLRFGGHRMAAGLEIEESQVAAFRAGLAAHAGERLTPADLVAVQHVDAVVGAGALTLELAEELERLGPFGAANPAPTLLVPAARVEHVTAMGEERAHARFSLVGGGARSRAVAFRTTQAALAACGAEPHDVAVSLERNRWNGREEARAVLCSLSRTHAGGVHDIGARPFWEELEAELVADPQRWWPEPEPEPEPAAPAPPHGLRRVIDRRHYGFAGLAGDLLSAGEPVLVVVADVARRRAGLESRVAGMAPGGLGAVSWSALGANPELAAPYTHLLALDPPPAPEGVELLARAGVELLARAPGAGMAHLAWGPEECDFAAAHWRAQLALRPALADLWRSLREEALQGGQLERALQGAGAYPRGGALAGRLLRVLGELGLADIDISARTCAPRHGPRTDLHRSVSNRAYVARLAAAERYLASTAMATPSAPAAGAGQPIYTRAS